MRKYPSARLFFSLTLVAGVAVWAACSDDSPATVDNGTPDSGVSDDQDSGIVNPFPDASPQDSAPEASSSSSGFVPPEVITIDGGPEFDGGLPCFGGGEPEQEPNNNVATANLLRTARCGIVKVPDGGADAGESDWLTFSWDAGTPFRLYYEGQVHVVVDTDGGGAVDISEPDSGLKLFYGQPYNVKITSRKDTSQLWRILLKGE